MHGKLYFDKYITAYIGINALPEFRQYKPNIRAMLKQMKDSINSDKINNVIHVLNNFYAWCKDDKKISYTRQIKLNINIEKLTICLNNMYNTTYEIWNNVTLHLLLNENDIFKLDDKILASLPNIKLKTISHDDNVHFLPKTAENICLYFILDIIKMYNDKY